MRLIKSIIKNLIKIDNNNLFNYIIKNKTLILLYHDVSKNPSDFSINHNLNVQPEVFEEQLLIISKYFNFISPKDYLNKNYKEPSCLITFDDGLESYFYTALPIMEKFKAPSLFFLNLEPIVEKKLLWIALICYLYENDVNFKNEVSQIFSSNSEDYFLYLKTEFVNNFISRNYLDLSIEEEVKKYCGKFSTLELLEKYQNHDLVYYGNHLYNHHNSANITINELEKSFSKNQEILNKFKNGLNLFAYPFGQPNTCYNKSTNAFLSEKTDHIFTSYPSLNYNNLNFISHRLSFDNEMKNSHDIKLSIFLGYIRSIFNKNSIRLI